MLFVQSQAPSPGPTEAWHPNGTQALLEATVKASPLAATGSGLITYNPQGSIISGADFSAYLTSAQSQPAITGQECKLTQPTAQAQLHLEHPKHAFGVIILVVPEESWSMHLKPLVFCTAGVQLQPGTYTVQPASGNGHIYLTCSARSSAFEISLAGSTLLFAVSQQPG